MATITKAELAKRTLERLQVVAIGQTPRSEDQNLVEDAIDSVYDQLRKRGLVPFDLATIPDWAQRPLMKIMSTEVAADFGRAASETQRAIGERELAIQVQTALQSTPVRFKDY